MSLSQPLLDNETLSQSTDNVVNLAAWRVRLRNSTGHSDVECNVREVNAAGLVVEAPAELGRYTWMDVDLPDGTGVSALGEIIPRRDPVELAVEVRFKHLFPDHRARLLNALSLQA